MAMVASAIPIRQKRIGTRETPLGARPCRSRSWFGENQIGRELPARIHKREDGMGRSPREMAASFR